MYTLMCDTPNLTNAQHICRRRHRLRSSMDIFQSIFAYTLYVFADTLLVYIDSMSTFLNICYNFVLTRTEWLIDKHRAPCKQNAKALWQIVYKYLFTLHHSAEA